MKRIKVQGNYSKIQADGLSYEGDQIVFDGTWSDVEIKAILSAMTPGREENKEFKSYKPEGWDLRKAREKVSDNVDVKELRFFRFIASSTRLDRTKDRFTKKYLEGFERQYKEGRSFLFHHDPMYAIGQTFDAKVEQAEDGEHELMVKFFILPEATLPGTGLNAARAIDTGTYSRASVGFSGLEGKYIPEEKSEFGTPYFLYENPENLLVHELSLVAMGANTDAKKKTSYLTPPTFDPIEQESQKTDEVELIKYTIKSLNQEVEIPEGLVKSIKDIDQKASDLADQVKSYKEAEVAREKAIRDEYEAKALQINPKATEDQKAEIKELAEALSIERLQVKIKALDKQIDALKNSTNPGEGGGADHKEFSIDNFLD